MSRKPKVMIVEARFYEEISDLLIAGATKVLGDLGLDFETFRVPGALEIPAAVRQGALSGKFDAYVALGCVIRGETAHFDIVAHESARGLMDLSVRDGLPIGNGILTCENKKQAVVRADPYQKNKGGEAAHAALAILDIKRKAGA